MKKLFVFILILMAQEVCKMHHATISKTYYQGRVS